MASIIMHITGGSVWKTTYYVFSKVYNNGAVWLNDITFLANFTTPIVWGIQKFISAKILLKWNFTNLKITALCLWIWFFDFFFGGCQYFNLRQCPVAQTLKQLTNNIQFKISKRCRRWSPTLKTEDTCLLKYLQV